MDDEIRRREAERQGRAAYMRGLERRASWPTDFLAAYDRAAADDLEEVSTKPRIPRGDLSHPVDLQRFKDVD